MPLFWASLSCIVGIWLASWWGGSWMVWFCAGVGGCGLAFLSSRLPWPWLHVGWNRLAALGVAPALLWAGITIGGARYQAVQPVFTPQSLAAHNGQGFSVLHGQVIAHPEVRDQAVYLDIAVDTIALPGQPATATRGRLRVRLPAGETWAYGDEVEVYGEPETPPENTDFSYRAFLSQQEIYTYLSAARVERRRSGLGNPLRAWIYALQDQAAAQVKRLYPAPEASLLAGILLGLDQDIPDSIQQAFKNTGTAHIIAISGFNIAILAGLFFKIFSRWWGRWRGAAFAAGAILFYTVLVGAGASVVRAAIMGCVGLLGQQIGRRQNGINTLAFTSAAMCLYRPNYLWDVSFQLSFMATLGLVLYAAPLQAAFQGLLQRHLPPQAARQAAEWVGEYFLFTLAAQITTLPLMAYHFGQVSWIAILANPLVLPPQPLVMCLGGLAVLLAWIWFPLGQLAAALAWPFVAYTIRMVEFWGRLPHGTLTLGQVSLALVALYYLLLFGGTALRTRWPALAQHLRPTLALAGLLALACLVWRAGLSQPDGRLHLYALNNDANGSFLITTPTDRAILINGGASFNQLSDFLGRRLPILDPRLDLVILSARTNADLEALPRALDLFPPRAMLWASDPNSRLRAVQTVRQSSSMAVQTAYSGQTIALGQGASLQVLASGPQGSVFLLEWGRFQALLPLQNDFDLMDAPPAQVLLLPSEQPAAALRPAPIFLLNAPHTWVDISTDGAQMWINGKSN